MNKQILVNNIKRIRESRGYSIYGISKLVNIHHETLKRMERGTCNIKALDVKTLADFYKVDINFFFTEKE